MIRVNVHPRTLPFDHIARSTYNLFHNNIFQQMATSNEEPPESASLPAPALDSHLQDTIGDPLQEKPQEVFRVVGQNINGISPRNDFNKWKEILQSTITHEIDALCISETNVEWRHPLVAAKLPAIIKRFFNHSRLTTTTSSIKFEKAYKPGGTAALLTNEWTGRIFQCEQDSSGLGRWTTTMMAGKQHRKIALISSYQVCKTSIHQCGLTTSFSQQWHLLRSQGHELPNPRERFWNDLTSHIHSLQAKQFQIILLGDFNTTNTKDEHNPVNNLLQKCNLSDAIEHFHECSTHTSYSRGTTIIDYCLVSTDLLPSIRACGYLPLYFLCFSDHRSFYVDFDSSILFGGSPPKISKPTARYVKSRDS